MKPNVAACLAEIRDCVRTGQRSIVPALFRPQFGLAAVSTAFRLAKREGILEVAYVSCAGTPVYQPAGTAAAALEPRGTIQ
jgi:hypothetical protein